MAKTLMALFDTYAEAQRAVQDLIDHGFSRDNISMISHRRDDTTAGDTGDASPAASSMAATGAGMGAAVGGIGGLLLGLSTLAIPGVGPALAAGPLAATLMGAGMGAAAGGLIGALTDLGAPEEEAGYYAEGVRRGSVLVAVGTEDTLVDRAVSILNRYNLIDLHERVAQWRQSGWARFDPNAAPYVPPIRQGGARQYVPSRAAGTASTATDKYTG